MKHIIEIDLDDRDEYVNEYNDDRISEDLHYYLLNYDFSFKEEVVIQVKFHYSVSVQEKERIKDMLYRDFQESLGHVKENLRKLNYQNIFLIILGLGLFLLSNFFASRDMKLFSEFFLVVTWVAFWEVAESFLFVRIKWLRKKKKYQQLLESQIIVE